MRLTSEAVPTLHPRGTVVLLLSSRSDRSGSAARALEVSEAWAAAGRRIVLADLHLEEPLLGQSTDGESLEGLVDVFLYGASLSRIARPSPSGRYYLIPAGTYSPDPEEIYQHPRWRKVIAGFEDTGATLLLFVPAESPALSDLSALATEAILLGGENLLEAERRLRASGIELVGYFDSETVEETPEPISADLPSGAELEPEPGQADVVPVRGNGPLAAQKAYTAELDELHLPPPPARTGGRKRRSLFIVGLLLVVLIVTTIYLLAALRRDARPGDGDPGAGTTPSAQEVVTASREGQLLQWSVQVKAFPSLAAARTHLETEQRRLSGIPLFISPEEIQGVLYYRVLAGMVTDTATAMVLRSRLVESGSVEADEAISTFDYLHYAPLAVDLGEYPTREQAMARSDSLLALEIPSYVAVIPYSDGSRRWRLYGGAYRDSSGAERMLELLRGSGIPGELTVRAGDPAPAFE